MKRKVFATMLLTSFPIAISTFCFAENEELLTAVSPSTNDTATSWPIIIFVVAAVAIIAALMLMKKKK